ncbi:hypothetical protein [Streptomyces sp. NRRL F-5126]|uniref:hypothetical protein n=1 Tax=Streptomyces sp. NRRL F-5126 TaxID=1463857 RepID=UPI0004C76FCE|nr:hypothetical protein [Streptomyces sp. NRRL F-5126]
MPEPAWYLHDFSELRPAELSAGGTYDYPWLDSYFVSSPRCEAYLITSGERLAGFAMIRSDVEDDEDAGDRAAVVRAAPAG